MGRRTPFSDTALIFLAYRIKRDIPSHAPRLSGRLLLPDDRKFRGLLFDKNDDHGSQYSKTNAAIASRLKRFLTELNVFALTQSKKYQHRRDFAFLRIFLNFSRANPV
jgi:hypothetical protein